MTDNPYLRAIEIIKRRGWHKGAFMGPNGEVCIAASLILAADARAPYGSELRQAMATVAPMPKALPPGDWNDAPERTVEDVYLALKHAAADWDAGHGAGVEVRETSA